MIENPNDMKEVYFMRYNVIGFRCTSTHATLAGLKEKLAEVRRKKGNVLCVAKFVKVPFDLSEVDGDSLTEGQDKPIPANWMYITDPNHKIRPGVDWVEVNGEWRLVQAGSMASFNGVKRLIALGYRVRCSIQDAPKQ